MNRTLLHTAAALAVALAASAAAAPPPPSDAQERQKLVDDLRALTARARAERAASPWLQTELDRLVQRHDWPWRQALLDETFRDGDYTRSPTWEVKEGSFWVDASLGLRSQATVPPNAEAAEADDTLTLTEIFMGMLASRTQSGASAPPPNTGTQQPPRNTPAVIMLPISAGNAFVLDFAFSQHRPASDPARVDFVLADGADGARGYRLSFRGGPQAGAVLRRTEYKRTSVLQRAALPSGLPTGAVQNVSWRRYADGRMVVLLNDKPLIEVTDRGAGESYRRLAVVNRGGDFALRRVKLYS
jgi:hypothetical protein